MTDRVCRPLPDRVVGIAGRMRPRTLRSVTSSRGFVGVRRQSPRLAPRDAPPLDRLHERPVCPGGELRLGLLLLRPRLRDGAEDLPIRADESDDAAAESRAITPNLEARTQLSRGWLPRRGVAPCSPSTAPSLPVSLGFPIRSPRNACDRRSVVVVRRQSDLPVESRSLSGDGLSLSSVHYKNSYLRPIFTS